MTIQDAKLYGPPCKYCGDWHALRGACRGDRLRAEIDRLRAVLTMVAESFEDWREPTPGSTTREWCERFNTYLRGCVVAQASFRPDQWAALREFMPNAQANGR